MLVIGDPHFQPSNLAEVDLFIDRIEKLAIERSPDVIVCLGDLLHTHERLNSTAMNKAYEFIRRMRECAAIRVYVLVGNHDMTTNQVFLTDDHWMNGMKEWDRVTIVDRVIRETILEYDLVFAPYVFPGRFEEALKTIDVDEDMYSWKQADCIFAHQEIRGCKMGAIISTDGDDWSLDYPPIVSGHIHSRQQPQENVYYVGSAMQHAFGESERNCVAILLFGGADAEFPYKLEEVDLCLPRKRIMYKDISEMSKFVPDATSSDKLKICVKGTASELAAFRSTAKYKMLIDAGVKVVFKPRAVDPSTVGIVTEDGNVNPDKTFRTILEELVRNEKNSDLDRDHLDMMLNIEK